MRDDSNRAPMDDERSVVEGLLSEMGVDEEMRHRLIESGRLSADVFKVESPDDVRRRSEIEKSLERLRLSLSAVERSISDTEGEIERVERDLIPVVLSFLVGLKGQLVSLRTSIVDKSKQRTKTTLQLTFVDTEVRSVVDSEFAVVEETLTASMSAPILERLRNISESLKGALDNTFRELAVLKSSIDDLVQRTTTEVDYLSKALSMKPRIEVPKHVEDKIKSLERRVEELTRDLTLKEQHEADRQRELERAQSEIVSLREKNNALEQTIVSLRSAPSMDASVLTELRQNIKMLETSRDMIAARLEEAEKHLAESEAGRKELLASLSERDIVIANLKTELSKLEATKRLIDEQTSEINQLRMRIMSYESGEFARQFEMMKTEFERIKSQNERLTTEYEQTRALLNATQARLDGYLRLMDSTEKTKAFLMVEENGRIAVREIARSLGVSPGQVLVWARDFERLNIARLVDDQVLELSRPT